ncbi:MAG: hypothetical protein R6V20_05385 [Desulfobia sp.]
MLKNITLSAEEKLIRKARERARKENTTLNASFRQWLEQYVRSEISPDDYDMLMDSLGYAESGRIFSRDELNER